MSDTNFIKNITSKDLKLSHNTIKTLIEKEEKDNFKLLCDSADFIFPFLKDRIIEDFVKLIEEENLETVFEFSKIYSSDFEDLIVNSWVKFACDDLTDEILELFEIGTIEQKAYAAKYFSKIQDPLALPFLNKEAFSDFSPLKINCAQTLKVFDDKTSLNQMMERVLNSNDEFEKESAFEFISVWGGDNSIKFIIRNGFKSPFVSNIISHLLDYNELGELKNVLDFHEILKIYNVLLNSYPEDIALDTLIYYQIYDFIKLIQSYKNQYAINLLFISKAKFDEFLNNENYSYDLDKNLKIELKKISNYLNSLELSVDKMERELEEAKNDALRFDVALEVIKEYKFYQFGQKIVDLVNSRSLKNRFLPSAVAVLREFKQTGLIKRMIIEEIDDLNIKALVESYL